MSHKLYLDPNEEVLLVRPPDFDDSTIPHGFKRVDEDFVHGKPGDILGWEGNHCLFHHIQKIMYHEGIQDMSRLAIRGADDELFPPLVPEDDPAPKLFQSDVPTKKFTKNISLGTRTTMLELAVLSYDLGTVKVTHAGEELELWHRESNEQGTLHILMFHGDLMTPNAGDLVIESEGTMLLLSGRANDYPDETKVGAYRSWAGQKQDTFTLPSQLENSQVIGMAATLMTKDNWGQRFAVSPTLYLRSESQQSVTSTEGWITTKPEDFVPYYPPTYKGVWGWREEDGWLINESGDPDTGHLRVTYPHEECSCFVEFEIEVDLPESIDSFAIRFFDGEDADETYIGSSQVGPMSGKQTIRVTNMSKAAGFYIYARGKRGGTCKIKNTIRYRMGNYMLQTNFVRGNGIHDKSTSYSMYFSRGNQGLTSMFGLSELAPLPTNP